MDANMANNLAKRVMGTDDADKGGDSSLSQMITTLVPVFATMVVFVLLFLVFRPRFRRIYQGRSFLGRPESRSPTMPQGMFNWIGAFNKIPDEYVLQHHSLDSYFFLRFLKITVVMCFVGCLITWPVLFPVNATGGGTAKGLNILTYQNITNPWRYWAHAGCACIFFSFVIYMITRETVYFINLRQAYLLSPLYASRISSRTVLYASVPEEYMNQAKLRAMLGPEVRQIWFAQDTKEIEESVSDRDKAAMKLEGAETKLMKTANKNRLKALKKGSKNSESAGDEEAAAGQSSGAQWITPKDRPQHRLKFLIGKKVDTIDWCRSELQRLIPEVNKQQAVHQSHEATNLNSVFVEFSTVGAAQAAYQTVTHHQALHMSPRFAGVKPEEVIWSNLRIKWWERVLRRIATMTFVVLLIIFWAIPVAAVGAISNINQLKTAKGFTWLQFLDKIPSPILGIVTGLLPVILLAVLMALLPIILRAMAKIGGAPTRSAVELTTQNFYFAFLIIHVFLVATIGASASAVGQQIAMDPSSAASLLATKIPAASNFYLSYFILQGLGSFGSILLAIVGLIVFKLLGHFLDGTPRKMYNRWINLAGIGWGTLFPIYTNLFVIATCYIVIAPLVMGFAFVGLGLFYIAYRYNLLFVSNAAIDTQGRVYARALQQLFVGLYVAEVTMVGMFAISIDKGVGAIGPLILMILMVVFTALYHVSFNNALGPLIEYIPKSLEAEERHLQAIEKGEPMDGEFGNGHGLHDKEAQTSRSSTLVPAEKKKSNIFTKWLRPDVYCDYAAMRQMVPKNIAVDYTREEEAGAFFNPAITSETPLLWIPRDEMGMSREAISETGKVIPITDEGAYFNEKNKIVWDAEDRQPPIYQKTPYY